MREAARQGGQEHTKMKGEDNWIMYLRTTDRFLSNIATYLKETGSKYCTVNKTVQNAVGI